MDRGVTGSDARIKSLIQVIRETSNVGCRRGRLPPVPPDQSVPTKQLPFIRHSFRHNEVERREVIRCAGVCQEQVLLSAIPRVDTKELQRAIVAVSGDSVASWIVDADRNVVRGQGNCCVYDLIKVL